MRLKSEFWVKAYLRRCTGAGAMATVLRHGDDDAGAIFIKVVRGDRQALVFAPAPAGLAHTDNGTDAGSDLGRRFMPAFKGAAVAEADADALLQREASFDSDVWVVEIEERDGRHFLDGDLVAS